MANDIDLVIDFLLFLLQFHVPVWLAVETVVLVQVDEVSNTSVLAHTFWIYAVLYFSLNVIQKFLERKGEI